MTAVVGSEGLAPPRAGVGRIGDRATFRALRRGRRARHGAVSVTYVPGPGARVAFAIGKGAGGAVVRNRIRRRLRAAARALHAAGVLPAGAYLVGGGPELARMPWSALCADLEAAVAAATGGPA